MTMGTLFQIPSPLSAPDLQLALSHVRSIRGHVLDVLFEGSEIPVEDHFCISLNHSTQQHFSSQIRQRTRERIDTYSHCCQYFRYR